MSRLVEYDSSTGESEDDEMSGTDNPHPSAPGAQLLSARCGIGKESRAAATTLLPVPTSVRHLFADDDADRVDYPALHGGRQRAFAHERGNWATHIYVTPADECQQLLLDEVADALTATLNQHGSGRWVFSACDDIHISLSRTFAIRHHCILPLSESLRKVMCGLEAFPVTLSGIEAYVNDERTRTFVGLTVARGSPELLRTVVAVDSVLADYGLPVYYSQPSFHASLCWALGDLSASIGPALAAARASGLGTDTADFFIADVCCKCGNKTSRLRLAADVLDAYAM